MEPEKGGRRNVLHLKHPFDNFLLAQSGSRASGVWFGEKRPAGGFEYHLGIVTEGQSVITLVLKVYFHEGGKGLAETNRSSGRKVRLYSSRELRKVFLIRCHHSQYLRLSNTVFQ